MKAWPAILIVLLIVGMSLWIFGREPRYQGRSLSSWLWTIEAAPREGTPDILAAREAVRAIGAKAALPTLLKLIQTRDDPVSQWMRDTGERLRISGEFEQGLIHWHEAEDFQLLGIAGFDALGTNAAAAMPALAKLLEDKDTAPIAERCLEMIGKPTESLLCQELTNQDANIRQWSLGNLVYVTDDVGVYIARIQPRLQDVSEAVRGTTVDLIGQQTSAPELAVPLLLGALNDLSAGVRSRAVNALAGFGTNAEVAIPKLTQLVNSDAAVADVALSALIRIAPGRGLPVFTNYIARGETNVDAALKAMAEVLPDEALPVLLNRLQSPDHKIRSDAFSLLRHYPATPQIETVMQAIATGTNSDWVPDAKGYLTDLYVTNHPEELLFPDEPSYGGKRLGQWLAMRDPNTSDFTPEAKEAIRHLGTNAIPFLWKRLVYVRPPYCFSGMQININAAAGFMQLGEPAKAMQPQFQMLMDGTNKDVVLSAMVAAFGTDTNATACLLKGLTNQFPIVRGDAADILGASVNVNNQAQREQALPLIAKLLNDPDEDVRGSVTNALKEIDPSMATRNGIK